MKKMLVMDITKTMVEITKIVERGEFRKEQREYILGEVAKAKEVIEEGQKFITLRVDF